MTQPLNVEPCTAAGDPLALPAEHVRCVKRQRIVICLQRVLLPASAATDCTDDEQVIISSAKHKSARQDLFSCGMSASCRWASCKWAWWLLRCSGRGHPQYGGFAHEGVGDVAVVDGGRRGHVAARLNALIRLQQRDGGPRPRQLHVGLVEVPQARDGLHAAPSNLQTACLLRYGMDRCMPDTSYGKSQPTRRLTPHAVTILGAVHAACRSSQPAPRRGLSCCMHRACMVPAARAQGAAPGSTLQNGRTQPGSPRAGPWG